MMRADDFGRLLQRIHDSLMDAVWRGPEVLAVLQDPEVLIREVGLDAGDLEQWLLANIFWNHLVLEYDRREGDGAHLTATVVTTKETIE